MGDQIDEILKIFLNNLKEYPDIEKNAFIVNYEKYLGVYIKTIAEYIDKNNEEKTFEGIYNSIENTTELLLLKLIEKKIIPKCRISLSLEATSQVITHLLHKYISQKTSEEINRFKQHLVNITNDLYILSYLSKDKIFYFFKKMLNNNMKILIHGYSSQISYCLKQARKEGKFLNVFITVSENDNNALIFEKEMKENDIKCKLITGISIAYYLKEVDCVLVGADAICENGGIINKIGTLTCAVCAKNYKKPFYVIADSLKFMKLYVLDQNDIAPQLSKYISHDNNKVTYDFTPPEFITLFFTDNGILTPSAVSDQLILMFYN